MKKSAWEFWLLDIIFTIWWGLSAIGLLILAARINLWSLLALPLVVGMIYMMCEDIPKKWKNYHG